MIVETAFTLNSLIATAPPPSPSFAEDTESRVENNRLKYRQEYDIFITAYGEKQGHLFFSDVVKRPHDFCYDEKPLVQNFARKLLGIHEIDDVVRRGKIGPAREALFFLFLRLNGELWVKASPGWSDPSMPLSTPWYGLSVRKPRNDASFMSSLIQAPTAVGSAVRESIAYLSGYETNSYDHDAFCTITGLKLVGNGLSGDIDVALETLRQLQLSGLARIVELNLASNELAGDIGNLSNIRSLRFLGSSLQVICLNFNNLSGRLVNVFSIFGSTTVNTRDNSVRTSQDDMTHHKKGFAGGMDERSHSLGRSSSKESPTLSQSIPQDIFSHIRVLALQHNALTGPIPAFGINLCPNLKILHLYENKFIGRLPTSLRGLHELEELRLWGNQLEGKIPAEYGELEKLKVLALNDNKLEGSIPSTLGGCRGLTHLFLNDNQLEGPLPLRDLFEETAALTVVNLADNEHLFDEFADQSSTSKYSNAEAQLASLLPNAKLLLWPESPEIFLGDK